jgi:hypothetical protein
MPACATCLEEPCQCERVARAGCGQDGFERFLAFRSQAVRLSADYVAWLDGDGEDAEPDVGADVRRRILRLLEDGDALGPSWGAAQPATRQ